MQPAKKIHPGITALIVIVLIGVASTAAIVINNGSKATVPSSSSQTSQQTTDTTSTTTSTDTSNYKDGTYNATGSYLTPGGRQSIQLTVTIQGGVITSTSVINNATNGDSREYQSVFTSAYKDFVIGKNIDRVSLSRVAGSSLTSSGFNTALDQIKQDAKA